MNKFFLLKIKWINYKFIEKKKSTNKPKTKGTNMYNKISKHLFSKQHTNITSNIRKKKLTLIDLNKIHMIIITIISPLIFLSIFSQRSLPFHCASWPLLGQNKTYAPLLGQNKTNADLVKKDTE